MLDIKLIKENPDAVKAGLRAKEVDCDEIVDRILELDEQRRALIASTEERKARQNTVAKEIPMLKKQGWDVTHYEEPDATHAWGFWDQEIRKFINFIFED